MISKLINVLQGIGLDQTPEYLADMLWLARHLDKPDLSLEKKSSIEQEQNEQPCSKPPDLKPAKDISNESPKANLYPHTSQTQKKIKATSAGMESTPFKSPAGYALPGKLAISRSLRPLMRKVPSRKNMIFDEHATVHNIAETDTWIPVLKPDRSHWLDVVLIVDESPSMIIWYETIFEFKELLERQGAFKSVQLWGFIYDEEKKTICLHEGLCFARNPQRTRHPKELIDPTNRRLILIISDCVSNSWHDGTVSQLLKKWHSNSRVAIVQMLPHYLWKRTCLKKAEHVYFQNISSNAVNSKLEIEPSPFGEQESVSKSLKLPVITLEDRSILPWTKSLAGIPNVWLPGILLELSPNKMLEEHCDKKKWSDSNKSIHDKLKYFMATASPEAQDLLRCLAALPLTLSVIRLAQRVILPNSRQIHLAEVLLSGLLKEKELKVSYPVNDELSFELENEIRELLVRSQPVNETINALSIYIENHIGGQKTLIALVSNPNDCSSLLKNNLLAPFAQITTRILRLLGGKYIDLAEQIELLTNTPLNKTKNSDLNKEKTQHELFSDQEITQQINNNVNYQFQSKPEILSVDPTALRKKKSKNKKNTITDINIIINSLLEDSNWEKTKTYQKLEHYLKKESGLTVNLESIHENLIAFKVDNISSVIKHKRQIFEEQSECILFITRCTIASIKYFVKIEEQVMTIMFQLGLSGHSHLLYVIDNNHEMINSFQEEFNDFFISDQDGLKSMMQSSSPIEYIYDRIRKIKLCPFHYLGPSDPNLFVGRSELRNEILYNKNEYTFAIAGSRRIGKSSLLMKIMSDINSSDLKEKFYPIFIDCNMYESYPTLITEINRKLNPILGAIHNENFNSILSRGFRGNPIMLLLDEMDAFIHNVKTSGDDLQRFESTIRSIKNTKRAKVIIVGFREVMDLVTDASHPCYNLFERKALGMLSFEEVRQLIATPFRELLFEIEESNELVHQIYNTTSGHPQLVQYIAKKLFDVSDKRSIRLEDLSNIVEQEELYEFVNELLLINTMPLERLICLLTIEKETIKPDDILAIFDDNHITIDDPGKTVKNALNYLQYSNLLKKDGSMYSCHLPLIKRIYNLSYLNKSLVTDVKNLFEYLRK